MPTIRLPIHLFQFTPLREGRQPKRGIRWQTMNFNSRPSARGDINRLQASQSSMYFNSRPSARGDILQRPARCLLHDFNSRPSARGDLEQVGDIVGVDKFQFTPLREGRPFSSQGDGRRNRHFNSRPSARGDGVDSDGKPTKAIISIHAPPRGATGSVSLIGQQNSFQFTPLREGRRGQARRRNEHPEISIHAPPRGATGLGDLIVEKVDISIHAPPRGATRVPWPPGKDL